MIFFPARASRAAIFISSIFVGNIFLAGCAKTGPSELVFRSDETHERFSQQFNQAYYSRNQAGEYRVILINDALSARPTNDSGPLEPARGVMLSQIVDMRIRWRPLGGSTPDAPSATNTVIDWYVRGGESAGRDDHLHYRGAGFVTVRDTKGRLRCDVRNAHLEPAGSAGDLRDPLGPSTLRGSFIAARDDARVDAAVELNESTK